MFTIQSQKEPDRDCTIETGTRVNCHRTIENLRATFSTRTNMVAISEMWNERAKVSRYQIVETPIWGCDARGQISFSFSLTLMTVFPGRWFNLIFSAPFRELCAGGNGPPVLASG